MLHKGSKGWINRGKKRWNDGNNKVTENLMLEDLTDILSELAVCQ